MSSFVDRVAAKAVDVSVVKILLSLLAMPFYVLGLLAAVVVIASRWVYSAAVVGYQDARGKLAPPGDV